MRRFIVTAGYLGLCPIAPGTAGSLLGVAIYVATAQTPYAEWLNAGFLLLFCALNLWLCPWAEAHYGKKDPSQFVIDEVAGYLLAALCLPPAALWVRAAAAFVAARAFDVVKPPPARQLEALPAGWGILLDDLAASVYANLVLQFALRWRLAG